jgi:hypothetical protein
MQSRPLPNNPLLFWLGLILVLAGIAAAWLYLIGPHIAIFGPGVHIKHGLASIALAIAGAVLASFARPRGTTVSSATGVNR